MFGFKCIVLFHAVGRNADDFRVKGGEFCAFGRKIKGLRGATGCVVFGVKVKYQIFARKIGQGKRLSAICGQRKIRRATADVKFWMTAIIFSLLCDNRYKSQ